MSKNLKFIFISIVFILFLLIFNSSVFASDTITVNVNNEEYILTKPTNSNYILTYNNGTFYLDVFSTTIGEDFHFTLESYTSTNHCFIFDGTFYHYQYNMSSNSWDFVRTYGDDNNRVNLGGTFITASHDIITSSGESFFQLPPPTIMKVAIIPKKVEGIQMTEVLREVIQIIPLIIAILGSFLGLRKALQILFSLLRRCLII